MFVLGFMTCFVLFCVSYAVVRTIIFQYGNVISRTVENEIGRLIDKSIGGTTISYPELERERFQENGEVEIDSLLKY